MGVVGSESPPALKIGHFAGQKLDPGPTAQLLLVKSKQKVTNKSKSFHRVTSDTPPPSKAMLVKLRHWIRDKEVSHPRTISHGSLTRFKMQGQFSHLST